jgi:hypothetical protein
LPAQCSISTEGRGLFRLPLSQTQRLAAVNGGTAPTKYEESMNKTCKFAAGLGIGLALAPWAVAQAPASQPEDKPAVAAAIPVDQQATKEQLAKLFEVVRLREQLASVTKMMPALMQRQMQEQFKQMQKDHSEMKSMTEEQQQASAKVIGKYMERVMSIYPSDEMIADMSGIYQKYLTRSDVEGIIAFYGSPAGQHMLDMQPMIMKESMTIAMQRVQDRIKPLIDGMTKEMEDVVKSQAPPEKKSAGK